MPIDMVLNARPAGHSLSGDKPEVSSSDIRKFQEALQNAVPSATDSDAMRISDSATAGAAAEAMGIGENERKKRSLVEKMSSHIEGALMEGSTELQGFYKHMSSFSSGEQLAQGTTVLSLQMELMRATVLVDILTKVANKAATTIDSMIRLQ